MDYKRKFGLGATLSCAVGVLATIQSLFVQADGVTPGALQPGNIPVYTISDPLLSGAFTPSADGTSVNILVPAGYTGTTFNLTCTAINSAGVAITSGAVAVAVTGGTPPEGAATQIVFNQTV
jgi:hypothetical protein